MATGFKKKFFTWILTRSSCRFSIRVDVQKKGLFKNIHGKVLEIGPGTGINVKYFPKDIEYVALEPNSEMYAYLKKTLHDQGIRGAQIIDTSAEAMPFTDNSFDVVVSTFVLCSVPDQSKTLREIMRVLKPGGSFLFFEHVAARKHTFLRKMQHYARGISKLLADGCDPERETAASIRTTGFISVEIQDLIIPVVSLAKSCIAGSARK